MKRKRHTTDACHLYGFHDIRRAFATENAEKLSAGELQALMRRKSYTTTQGHINTAKRLNRTAEKLHVPAVLTNYSAS
jgi:integrase